MSQRRIDVVTLKLKPERLKLHPTFTVPLWSINRWLRWSGFRLTVQVEAPEKWSWAATRIGFAFWGWRGWTEGYSL